MHLAFLRKSIFVPLCLYVIYSLSPQKIKRQFTNNTIPMLTVPCCTFHLAACRCTAHWPTKPCELVAILFPVIIFIACFHATRRPGERFALKFNYCHLVVSSPRSCFFISTRPLPFQGNLLSPPRVYWLDAAATVPLWDESSPRRADRSAEAKVDLHLFLYNQLL